MIGRKRSRLALGVAVGLAAFVVASLVVLAEDGRLPKPIVDALQAQKRAGEQRELERDARARHVPPAPKNPDLGLGAPIATAAPLPTGVFEEAQAPFPASHGYSIVNSWRGIAGDVYVQAYAGSMRADSADGILVLRLTSRVDLSSRGGDLYHAPGRPGSLRVLSETGGVLRLGSASGLILTFDVRTRTFGAA